MKTTLQEVTEQMKTMQDQKAAELATIRDRMKEARADLDAAEDAIRTATEQTDIEAYEAATAARNRAQAALDMYDGRYKQIEAREYISEEESDRVIDSLKAYEEEISAAFVEEISYHYDALNKLLSDYLQEIRETEYTMQSWAANIHPNYRSTGTRYAETGTNRSPVPVPIRNTPYKGCSESVKLNEFLKNSL